MAQATRLHLHATDRIPDSAVPLISADDAQLRDALKYCAPSTYEAARQFRETGRPEFLPAVVFGVISRYVEPDSRVRLQTPSDELQLGRDLGLDSLALMEIVIRLEEVLQISIRDDELRQFRTLGEVRGLIVRAVINSGQMAPPTTARP